MSSVLALPAIVLAIAIGDATLTSAAVLESRAHLVRKETEVLEQAQTPTVVINDGGNETHDANGVARINATQAAINFVVTDHCDADYPLGTADTVDCSGTGYDKIYDQSVCKQAAVEANVSHPDNQFWVPYTEQNIKPKGCFTAPCGDDPPHYDDTMTCYYFNPVLGQPEPSRASPPQDSVSGRPICKRPKYLHGAHHDTTAAFTDGGCPTGYETIKNELNCSEAASCMGLNKGTIFIITEGNRSQRDHHPEGCFLQDPTDANAQPIVFFNPIIDDGTTPKPRWPKGTPICNVSTITFMVDGVLDAVDSHLHHHAIASTRTLW